jgi:hypothetical protein
MIALVLVVPWSTAITYLSTVALPSFIDGSALLKRIAQSAIRVNRYVFSLDRLLFKTAGSFD